MLLLSALGDAYGAGFEFETPENIALHNDLTHYKPHALYTEICGRYTDDTQMSLAIVELMLSQAEWTPERIADGFVAAFHRDPRRGYSSRFYDLLLQVRSGKELIQLLNPASERNGAAMRAHAIGLYADVHEVLAKAEMQARITHATPLGIGSAQATALAAHYLRYDIGPKKDLGAYIASTLRDDLWQQPWTTEVTMQADEAVRAAITLIEAGDRLSGILKQAIALGGDVDTVGAVALGCAGFSREITNDLPEWMLRDFEPGNGQYGGAYIQQRQADLERIFA